MMPISALVEFLKAIKLEASKSLSVFLQGVPTDRLVSFSLIRDVIDISTQARMRLLLQPDRTSINMHILYSVAII
jgi:hypothetical protein